MDVAIVGAGVAGLAAARRLAETRPGLAVTVFDKVHIVGGRAKSHHVHGAVVDHGAQYLKTPTAELHRYITHTLGHAQPLDIGRDVWVFDGSGKISPGDPEENAGEKWTYADGLERLPLAMSEGLDVRSNTLIEQLRATDDGYDLVAGGEVVGHSRAVLLTPPAPLTLTLIGASTLPSTQRKAIMQELGSVVYRHCISVALGYRKVPAQPPYYALVNPDRGHPISWVAYEHLKPQRQMNNQGVMLVQMAPDWSAAHHTQPHALLADDVAALLATLLGKEFGRFDWFDCFCWRYALPKSGCDVGALETDGLFFAGDYVAGQGRLHLAIESGWAAADRILEHMGNGATE
jgi:renalase